MTEADDKAKFTINGTPSSDDVTGDRIFKASNGQTITVQLESAIGISSVTYQLVDIATPSSPVASLNATAINWSVSGTPSEAPSLADGTAQFSMPVLGVHSYIIRARAILDDATVGIFDRIVATTTACGAWKTVPTERSEASLRGWADAQNKLIDCEGTGGSGGDWDIFIENDVTTTENTSTDLFLPILTGSNRSMTGRVELFAFETGTYSEATPVTARLAFDFTFYYGANHHGGGFEPNRGVLVTGIPAAIIEETGGGTEFATGTLALTFATFLAPPVFKVTAVHATGFTPDVKWCAVLFANECEGPIPDLDLP